MSAPPTRNLRNRCLDVAKYAIVLRSVVFLLVIASTTIIKNYESSANLALAPKSSAVHGMIKRLAQLFAHWDAFYFTLITKSGYSCKQEIASFPIFPLLTHMIACNVLVPLEGWIGSYQAHVLVGHVVSGTFSILAAVGIYKWTDYIMHNERLAYLLALFVIALPSRLLLPEGFLENLLVFFMGPALVFGAQLIVGKEESEVLAKDK